MSGRQLFDPGLQPERTELAWRRTTLALVVGALIALRLLPAVLGPWAISVGLTGLVLAALLWVLARRRAHQTAQSLVHNHGPLPGGVLLLLLATLTTAGAALGLLYVTLQ
jgi:putative membrane protein